MAGGSRLDRKFLRKFVEFPVRIRIVSSGTCPSGEVQGIAGICRSFSVGGIGFETRLPLTEGDIIQLLFTLPGEKREVELEASVRSSQKAGKKSRYPDLREVGVKFQNVSEEDIAYLTNYMSGTFLLF